MQERRQRWKIKSLFTGDPISQGTLISLWYGAVFRAKVGKGITDNRLVTTGVYAVCRNPIYSTFMLSCSGVLLISGNVFFYPLLFLEVMNWYDGIVIDKLWVGHSKFWVLPGTEDDPFVQTWGQVLKKRCVLTLIWIAGAALTAAGSVFGRMRRLKKLCPTDRPMTTPLFLFRCVQLGLSIRDLDLLTIGMVNDMYVESRNDGCPEAYVELATQADLDNF